MHSSSIFLIVPNFLHIHFILGILIGFIARALVKQGVEGQAVEDEQDDEDGDEQNGKPENMVLN